MVMSRRIPATRTQAYSAWSLPSVAGRGNSAVVKAEAQRAERRAAGTVQATPVKQESLEQQLVENIRSGRFVSGISARQLEAVVRDAAKEGREEGYRDGFARGEQEGRAEGRAEGLAGGRSFIEDAAGRLSCLISALQQPIAGQEQALGEAMLQLVTRIAREVIRTELRLQPESIQSVVMEALGALPVGASNVRVFVCPADVNLLEEFGGEGRDWTLVGDPALEPGDCRIETKESVVQYAVSDRFGELVTQLLAGHLSAGDRV